MSRYVLLTPPAEPLVSIEEAAAQVGVSSPGDDDARLSLCILAAVSNLDGRTGILGRALVTQKWRLECAAPDVNGFVPIELPPVQAVDSVSFIVDGTPVTVAPETYFLDFAGEAAFVRLRPGASWPVPDRRGTSVRVDFTAGYGGPEAVPSQIRAAALLGTSALFFLGGRDIATVRRTVDGVGSRAYDPEASARVLEQTAGRLITPFRSVSP